MLELDDADLRIDDTAARLDKREHRRRAVEEFGGQRLDQFGLMVGQQPAWVQTWVTSQWKNPPNLGQFSAQINIPTGEERLVSPTPSSR